MTQQERTVVILEGVDEFHRVLEEAMQSRGFAVRSARSWDSAGELLETLSESGSTISAEKR